MNTLQNSTSASGTPSSDTDITVMLVDDSAVIRGALSRVFEDIDGITVAKSVPDGELAIKVATSAQPDIVILDIEMPVMDGLTALPKILQASPKTKVIMFSSLTEKGASVTLQALRLGAVECLVKPSSATDVGKGSEFQRNLVGLIQNLVPHKRKDTAARATTAAPFPAPVTKGAEIQLRPETLIYKGKPGIVAIGSSTGGPQALFNVLKHCKGFDVPIIITQHMPPKFTKILAEHIQQHTGIEAHEGAEGMVVEAGKAYVAPGGFHMLFKNEGGRVTITLDDGPQVNFCKPAVDPMFESAINHYGQKVFGVILTGMGNDGIGGGTRLAKENGRLIAQDEETSVVWGMPGAVANAGVCNQILPIDDIGPTIRKVVMGV
ncbi:MAG: chemotaxis-specific protein-glutamate methyltransferase CheB [Alphaproteobacteria bacterium]